MLLGALVLNGLIQAHRDGVDRDAVDGDGQGNFVWSLFCVCFGALDYVSDCALAYFLRPTNLCHLDNPGGWQFWVQTIVVVLIPTCLLLTVGVPSFIGAGRPLLAATMLIGTVPASFPALRSFTVAVLVIFSDIPSVIVKSSFIINNQLNGTEADNYVWASLIFSALSIFIKPCSIFMGGSEQIFPDA